MSSRFLELSLSLFFFFLMIRRPPRSTHCISSAASDVYKRQVSTQSTWEQVLRDELQVKFGTIQRRLAFPLCKDDTLKSETVSYTHLRAHETRHDLVCRLLLEKKKKETHCGRIRQ
eukprot:TRINITY_DN7805_c0_g1_i1.p2 TRINITY_DN7805_c0_g1~~TRINITY_DN7805_c0_g1_i1.p2  ORF type:complete len:116 (+),score=29.17 TRINITY_DN7805_c0_g1_i1:76-423(+)